MTLRYAHLGDREIERAAECVGQKIAEIMEQQVKFRPQPGE
ncbi:MAG: hypothetical protein OXI74_07090 [Rhodospirillaceae bacterium]|nr:hypothetical protein [Rhodospirillaceae bacterium]